VALIICHIIAYVQILSAGFNLWGVDPRMLFNMPVGRNTLFVGLFLLAQLLGLAGAILIFQKMRLGFVLSIFHHLLLLPALVITSWGLVMLLDDRINVTLLFMGQPNGADVSLFWSLGWSTVFQQVTRNVPTGSTYIGINLFAFACATVLWVGMDETDEAKAEREMQMRRRQRQPRPRQLALPAPQPYEQQPRMYPRQGEERQQQRVRPQQGARQSQRMPPRGGRDYQW
jgi:hypothetical protein